VLNEVFMPPAVMQHLKQQCEFFRIDPFGLLKALVLQRIERIKSERELERELCKRPELVAACGLSRVPDHSTFSVFRKRIGNLVEDVFSALVCKLVEKGVIKADTIAVDSTHLKAYSSKYKLTDKDASFGHKSQKKTFYGYKAHMLCDTKTELPICLLVSTGKDHDAKQAIPLIDKNPVKHRMNTLLGDAAYYSTEIYARVIHYGAKPITDYRKRTADLPNIYKQRTAIERLFSRAKQSLNLDCLTFRGMHKVMQHCLLCFISMLVLALAAHKQNQPYNARSVTSIK
jgi:IS5 family transposase